MAFIHSFICQMWTGQYVPGIKCWGHSSEQNNPSPYLEEADILVRATGKC